MLKRSFAIIVLFLLSATVIWAVDAVTYTSDVKPILTANNCIGCHSDFETYTKIMAARSGQPQTQGLKIVVASNPDSSVIVWRLNGQTPSEITLNRMPLDGDPLPTDQKTTISTWISQGAVSGAPVGIVSPTWGVVKRLFRK